MTPAAIGALVCTLVMLAGCQREEEAANPPPRAVRAIAVEAAHPRSADTFSGHIEAHEQVSLAFRIGGRLTERFVNIGSEVHDGQPIARLEPQNELNALRSARAALSAAEGVLTQAENNFDRQRELLARNVTTQAYFEAAEQARNAAGSQVEAARAQLETAEDVVRFTKLDADAAGVVTAVGAEPGEVVQAGQAIVRLARRGGRDAVFNVPAQFLRSVSPDTVVNVRMADNPTAVAKGRVREISPQADPVTRTHQVRVGLTSPPPSFRLGTSVIGTVQTEAAPFLAVPATALVGEPKAQAVWVVDPKTSSVALRKVDVVRQEPATAFITKGLSAGDVVVTAGVNSLREGQTVRLLGAEL
ncbi:efflux RND transporter periplasmic adaptor subunit [Microvirga flavescens]|uniref:efflux RND transporter periplasmic adaptor subunit n=1 Tax=Microvirga flavescens TaxID=2249811 RepID=UPI000DD9ED0B|nr:efflux RND transporter periplasmic adaptor subunit [Microvirga flavescens]